MQRISFKLHNLELGQLHISRYISPRYSAARSYPLGGHNGERSLCFQLPSNSRSCDSAASNTATEASSSTSASVSLSTSRNDAFVLIYRETFFELIRVGREKIQQRLG